MLIQAYGFLKGEPDRGTEHVQNWCYTRAEVKMMKYRHFALRVPNIGSDECLPDTLQSATISLEGKIDLRFYTICIQL